MGRQHPILRREGNTKPSKYSRDEWKLVECVETGLVYLDNPVDYESLEVDFAWEKTYQQEKADRKKREPLFSALSSFCKKVRRKIRKEPKINTLPVELSLSCFQDEERINLLDIGCGGGNFGEYLAEKIASRTKKKTVPYGVEISEELHHKANACFAKLGGEVIHAPAIEGVRQLDDSSQHLVIMHSFLEHEVNPLELLELCIEKMTPGGLLIIKVPNFSCWNRLIRQQKWCGFRFPDHVNYFSPQNLKDLCKLAGFEIYRMNFFDRIPTSDNMWLVARKSGA